jgi:branched-chain amino acid transport system permease protein
MTTLLQQIVNGLAAGSVYALIAVGYNMVYGVLGFINFAHGDIYMFSTFIVLAMINLHVPFWGAVAIGLAAAAGLGLSVERIAYRPLRNANRIAPTVSAVGVALVLENAAQVIWGPATRPFPTPLPQNLFRIHGVVITAMQIIILVTAAAIATGLWAAVNHTSWGRKLRAIRDDLPTAELIGISVNRLVSSVYAVGAVLGAVSGVLFAAYYNSVYVTMGLTGTLNAFTAAVIGGIGSIAGSFTGGLALGLLQSLGTGYISSGYQNTITFVVLIAVLTLRPAGMFGKLTVVRA